MPSNTVDRVAPQQPALPSAQRISQATAVEQSRAVAEVQAAIIVAQQNPRDLARAWAEMQQSCGRLALASRAFYSVPNRGNGRSVHLARELARIWGNIDYGVKELRRDDEQHESEILAYAWDEQTNVRSTRSFIVPHARMVGKDRRALTDLSDVYLNNQNIGARAVRECVFTVLPADFTAEAEDLCAATIKKGDGKPLEQRIGDLIEHAKQNGVTVAQLEAKVGRKRGQWSAQEVGQFQVVWSSIGRNETRIEEEFPPATVTAAEIAGQQGSGKPAPARGEQQ